MLLEVADAPQRAKDLQFAGHQAIYGCEICTAKADPLVMEGRTIRSKRVWRPCSANRDRRNMKDTLELAEKAKSAGDISRLDHRNFGVKGRSHLFDLVNFDPTKQVLPEIMHMGFLGIVKLLTVLTFALGQPRMSANKNPRVKPEQLSKKLLKTKVPSEVCYFD